ncbi:MAG: hypothetical protein Q7V57_00425 [Actinomycetota bacterium]|nr:hypothetical protein [Actinomycetota bacterium]
MSSLEVMVVLVVVSRMGSRAVHGRSVSPGGVLERRPARLHDGPSAIRGFTLSPFERAVVGIHQHDRDVTFRASGNQWGLALALSFGAVIATIAVTAMTRGWVWLVPSTVASCLVAWTALLVRVKVRLTAEGIRVEGRLGAPVLYRWEQIDDAQVEVQESGGVWLRDMERPAIAQGVIHLTDGRWLNLPGFRCPMWGVDKTDDPLNNTDLKIGIVVRYRAFYIGPWPTPQP